MGIRSGRILERKGDTDEDVIVAVRAQLIRLGIWPVVLRIACEYGVAPVCVISRSHQPSHVRPRHHVWAVVRATTGASYPELGRMFAVDHTTVLSAVRRWESALNERYGRAA